MVILAGELTKGYRASGVWGMFDFWIWIMATAQHSLCEVILSCVICDGYIFLHIWYTFIKNLQNVK